jgi:hypothetical protein
MCHHAWESDFLNWLLDSDSMTITEQLPADLPSCRWLLRSSCRISSLSSLKSSMFAFSLWDLLNHAMDLYWASVMS